MRCSKGTFSNAEVSTESSSMEANSSILEIAIMRRSCFVRSVLVSRKSLLPSKRLSGFTQAIFSFQWSMKETI